MAAVPSTLRIAGGPESPVNEYRVNGGRLELRVLFPENGAPGEWRPLSLEEIIMHVNLETAVAHWMLQRLRETTA